MYEVGIVPVIFNLQSILLSQQKRISTEDARQSLLPTDLNSSIVLKIMVYLLKNYTPETPRPNLTTQKDEVKGKGLEKMTKIFENFPIFNACT